MKFAYINTFCGYGSTGRNALKKYNQLRTMGHDCKVYYGHIRDVSGNPDFVFLGNEVLRKVDVLFAQLFGLSGRLSFLATRQLIADLRSWRPDVVWLSNIHGNYINEYRLLTYLKEARVWTVYGMPDEYAFLGKCCSAYDCDKFKNPVGCYDCPHLRDYPQSLIFDNSHAKWELKKRAYEGFDRIVFRSAPYVIAKSQTSTLLRGMETFTTDSSVDSTGIFYPRDTTGLRERLGIPPENRVVLCCAPLADKLKGVRYYVDAARKCERDGITFLDVSFGSVTGSCPPNFIALPYEKDLDQLARYYSLADAYICPSISDAQPNTCLEALSCGTPVIGFNTSGVPYVAPNEFGTFVDEISGAALAEAIRLVSPKTPEAVEACRSYALGRFSLEAADVRLREFITEICARAERDRFSYRF